MAEERSVRKWIRRRRLARAGWAWIAILTMLGLLFVYGWKAGWWLKFGIAP